MNESPFCSRRLGDIGEGVKALATLSGFAVDKGGGGMLTLANS
jgi:hypothetical protein